MDKLIEKMVTADGFVVLTVTKVGKRFSTKIDHSDSMTPDIVNELLNQVVDIINKKK